MTGTIFGMLSYQALIVYLILCSNTLSSPDKWLKKTLRKQMETIKDLKSDIRHLDTKTSRIDKNVQIMRGELGKNNKLSIKGVVVGSCE